MAELARRDFLKLVGLTGTAAVMGCSSESARKLIPYLHPPEDIVPGKANWYASTCRECPAGCGMLVKNRDGRPIKVEGNPLHPINRGKLCGRGQASLQGLFNPDRYRGPLLRTTAGDFAAIDWDHAESRLVQELQQAVSKRRGEGVVLMTDLSSGTLNDLMDLWVAEMGGGRHVVYEPFAYEPLRKANQIVFGLDGIPSYRIDQADFLISFGAGFLETWLSNVEHARQFAAFRTPRAETKAGFVYVGPRLSMTAANADRWIPVEPGDEVLVALGMLKVILGSALSERLSAAQKRVLSSMVAPVSLAAVVAKTAVSEESLRQLAETFMHAQRPLALAEGLSLTAPHALDTAVAANLLCTLLPGTGKTIDWTQRSGYGSVASAAEMKELTDRMMRGDVDLLLIHHANPMFSLPASWEMATALEFVPMVVTFSSAPDETSQFAHLVLPTHTPLESWGDYAPREGVTGLLQPLMGPLHNTRHLGDLLLATGKQVKGAELFAAEDFYQLLHAVWQQKGRKHWPGTPPESFWQECMKRGGAWEDTPPPAAKPLRAVSTFPFPAAKTAERKEPGFQLAAYPTIQFFDGRGASRPWLQEMPDPIAQVTYGSWVEIHLETAKELDVRDGDLLVVKSPYGSLEAPAFPLPTVPRNTVALPIGQGHTAAGRYAQIEYGNPMRLLSSQIDGSCGGFHRSPFTVTLEKKNRKSPVAHTDGSLYQFGRGFALSMAFQDYREGIAAQQKPHLYLPLPEGYTSEKDFYPPHEHIDYRWGMVVDLDRCIGCGACVVACYAENNVAIVGKEQILKGREMSWLRIQRYFDEDRPVARFLPMFCQHCDNAPCESVCPVYAPHHSREGLNNQVYNRCIGTRFCAQNCPYKVRRFNWFTFTRPEPLNWQLNPDVTVRQKGVMEKCSFCVQRIIEAKLRAKDEGRKVRDGEFTTACAQTCPTDALIFGNLMDPESRVSRLITEHRAYQVLDYLNTKPAVIYLKKLTQDKALS